MKNQLYAHDLSKLKNNIALHKLVDQLMKGLLPLAVRRKSFILNNIDRDFRLNTDEDMLALVLWNMLNGAVTNTENECIHVDAVLNGHCTMIQVKDKGSYFYSSISDRLKQLQPVVEKLGGFISIYSDTIKGTTIAFTISNEQKVA